MNPTETTIQNVLIAANCLCWLIFLLWKAAMVRHSGKLKTKPEPETKFIQLYIGGEFFCHFETPYFQNICIKVPILILENLVQTYRNFPYKHKTFVFTNKPFIMSGMYDCCDPELVKSFRAVKQHLNKTQNPQNRNSYPKNEFLKEGDLESREKN